MTVTIYRAAKLSRIPKGTLYSQRDMIPRPVYFVKVKGEYLINTADPMWCAYVEDYRIRKGFKTLDADNLKYLVKAVVTVIIEVYEPSEKRLQELLLKINKQFQVNQNE